MLIGSNCQKKDEREVPTEKAAKVVQIKQISLKDSYGWSLWWRTRTYACVEEFFYSDGKVEMGHWTTDFLNSQKKKSINLHSFQQKFRSIERKKDPSNLYEINSDTGCHCCMNKLKWTALVPRLLQSPSQSLFGLATQRTLCLVAWRDQTTAVIDT